MPLIFFFRFSDEVVVLPFSDPNETFHSYFIDEEADPEIKTVS